MTNVTVNPTVYRVTLNLDDTSLFSAASAASAAASASAAAASASSASGSASAAAASAAAALASETAAAASEAAAAASESASLSSESAAASSEDAAASLVALLEASVNPLDILYAHDNGFSIDMTADDIECQVKDTTTPGNEFSGLLEDYVASTVFTKPKLCMQEDGSYKWSNHNLVLRSGDFSNASWTKQNATITTGQTGPEGTIEASLMTSSNTPSSVRQTPSDPVVTRSGAWVVKAGTSSFCYININDGGDNITYFNLATGAVGTNAAGNDYEITPLNDDGNAYLDGWYYVKVTRVAPLISAAVWFGHCDADASTAVTTGRTILASRAQIHRGLLRQVYRETVAAISIGTPYDWTPGSKHVLIASTGVTYPSTYSEDGTNVAWTKTNGTAALDATGPFGELCTSFEATSADGTIIQAVTSATALNCFAPLVRRKTGTGAIYATVDNGSNWTEITDDIGVAGGDYLRIPFLSGGVDPDIGFKVETSGDAIEFSCASVNASISGLAPPMTTYRSSVATSNEVFRIPLADLPSGDNLVAMFDVWTGQQTPAAVSRSVGFVGAAHSQYIQIIDSTINQLLMSSTPGSSYGTTTSPGGWEADSTIQASIRYKDGDVCFSTNGEAPYPNPGITGVSLDNIAINAGMMLWLRRLAFTPDYVGDADLRTEFCDQTAATFNSNNLAWSYISANGAIEDPGAFYNSRIPNGVKLYETDNEVGLMGFASQINHTTGEYPARIITRGWTFDKTTHVLTETIPITVLVEDTTHGAGWAGGVVGYAGLSTPIKVRTGTHKGRLLFLYTQEDNATGNPADPRKSPVYQMYSDDNGTTWSAGAIILSPMDVFGTELGVLYPSFHHVQYMEGAYEGRIFVPVEAIAGVLGFWTDDGGDTWEASVAVHTDAGKTLAEPAAELFPDNTLLIVSRNNTSVGAARRFCTSTDGGETFSAWDDLPNATESIYGQVMTCLRQYDMDGKFGPYGRMLYAGASYNPLTHSDARINYKIREMTDTATYQFADDVDSYSPTPPLRGVGYANLVHLYSNVFALFHESSSSLGFNLGGGYTAVLIFEYPT